MVFRKATVLAALCVALFPLISNAEELQPGAVEIDGCSGTVIAKGKEWAFGLSAAHCAVPGKKVTVILESGKKIKGEWISVDKVTDLSLFKVPAGEVEGVCSVGDPGKSFTGHGRHGPKALEYKRVGAVIENKTKRELLRAEYKLKEGKFDNGDSGGGVFSNGKLVGVISHESEDSDILAATHDQVISFVAKQKSLSYKITTADGGRWGDRERTEEILKLKKRLKELEDRLNSIAIKPGPPGPPGKDGASGRDGSPGSDANTTGIEARLSTVERWIRNFRAVVRVRLKGE